MLREAARAAARGQTVHVVGVRQDDLERLRSIARDTLGPLVAGETSNGDLVVGLGVLHFVPAMAVDLEPFTWDRLSLWSFRANKGPLFVDHTVFDTRGTPNGTR